MSRPRAVRNLLLAACAGAALCGAGTGSALAQALPFQQFPFGYAGPVGIAGAPWSWWSIGQPIVSTAPWAEPMAFAWSAAAVGSSNPARYGIPGSLSAPAPQLAGALNWGASVGRAAASSSPFLLNWSSPYVLNGASIHAW